MLSEAERERQESWALMARLAALRGAPSGQPGGFPDDAEAEYQALRAEIEARRALDAAGQLDRAAHGRLRARARALIRRLEDED
jgi:hypothetical protein